MLSTIAIPRPHVPTGPQGVPEDRADADYLRAVVAKLDSGYARVGGSGVTAMVRGLITDAADTIDAPEQTPGRDIVQLVRDLTDSGDCWFDHHGGCQEHGYLTLQPGQMCPHAEAKAWLAKVDPDADERAQRDAVEARLEAALDEAGDRTQHHGEGCVESTHCPDCSASPTRCCRTHGLHSTPHRGCILR